MTMASLTDREVNASAKILSLKAKAIRIDYHGQGWELER